MVPKLNRGNKQVSVVSLRAVCNMLLAVLVKLPWLTGTAVPQPHPCHLLPLLREGRTVKCVSFRLLVPMLQQGQFLQPVPKSLSWLGMKMVLWVQAKLQRSSWWR